MIIKTSRSRIGTAVDILLTALAWIGFVYLFGTGIASVFNGVVSSPRVDLADRILPSAGTLTTYLVVACANAMILLAWAAYNARRFGGLDRRSRAQPPNEERLARGFGVDVVLRLRSARARVMTVHHTEDGAIRRINFHRMGFPAAA